MKLKEYTLPVTAMLCNTGILYKGNAAELISAPVRLFNTSIINLTTQY